METLLTFLSSTTFLSTVTLCILSAFILIFVVTRTSLRPKNLLHVNTMVVLGSGGHTKEMLNLLTALEKRCTDGGHCQYNPILYVVANTDTMSHQKAEALERERCTKQSALPREFAFLTIPRSREVRQSYITSIFTTLYSVWYCFPLVFRHRPDLVICNGPGTCIPICFAAFIFRMTMIKRCRIVFVESICRVKTLSLSGKLLYYVADTFLVQWPDLLVAYPKALYFGRFV